MELRIYFRMLQKGWWIIALTALVAMSVALIFAYFQTPIYRASATYVVSPSPTQLSSADVMRSLDTLDKRSVVTTYAEFLNSNRVYQQTLATLKLAREDVTRYIYSAVVLPDANVLELSVDGPDPALAALLVNTMGTTAINLIQPLYPVYDISPLDIAVAPSIPISPQPLRDASLAFVLGLVIGSALVVLREQLLIPLETYRQRKYIDRESNAFTRRYFNTLIENEISHGSGDSFAIGLVRLNGLGDLTGVLPPSLISRLLTDVNKILRRQLRGNDVVGRWDETSFAILLPATPESAAQRTMQRILAALEKPIFLESNTESINLDPSVGTVSSRPGEHPRELSERVENSIEISVPTSRASY